MIFAPGSRYDYSNPGLGMLTYCVTVALQDTPWQNVRQLLKDRISDPVGLSENDWSIGYSLTFELEGIGHVASWGGGGFTARAVARLGQLMLQKGGWEGLQRIDPVVAKETTSFAHTPSPEAERSQGNPASASGLGWWTNWTLRWHLGRCPA